MKDKAFWISPEGKVVDVPLSHISMVTAHPGAFGLKKSYVKEAYAKY